MWWARTGYYVSEAPSACLSPPHLAGVARPPARARAYVMAARVAPPATPEPAMLTVGGLNRPWWVGTGCCLSGLGMSWELVGEVGLDGLGVHLGLLEFA